MKLEQRHVIGTRAFHVGIQRQDSATRLMEATDALWQAGLAADAEAIFSACCSPGERVRLERVELALGTIPETAFTTDLPVRFRAALTAELLRQLARVRRAPRESGAVAPAEHSVLELLEYVLLHGVLPWWGPGEFNFDPARELAAALLQMPQEMAALARQIGRHQRVRFRLAHWLADPEIAMLIRAVAAGDAEFVLRYAEDLDRRQREERLVATGAEEFRHAKWEIILGHLLADRGSRFNAKSFLRQTLGALASRFRLEYVALLSEFARIAVEARVTWRESSLPQLLGELYAEDVLPGAATAESSSEEQVQQSARDSEPTVPIPPARQAIARWDELLRESALANATSPQHSRALAFWRILSSAETRFVLETLITRHQRTKLAKHIVALFSAAERDALQRLITDEFDEAAPDRPSEPSLDLRLLAAEIGDTTIDPEAVVPDMPALRGVLETGALPAAPWSRGRWHGRAKAWVQWMLARHAESAPPLLRAWARPGRLTEAMVARFDDVVLVSVVETVIPEHAEEVTTFVQTAARAHRSAPFVSVQPDTFHRGVWKVVLDYVLSDRGSVFNTRTFLAHSIDGLAARHHVRSEVVMEFLLAAAKAEGRHPLLRDLHTIAAARAEHASDEPEIVSPTAASASSAPLFFTPENLRRSPLTRLRLLHLLLEGAPLASEPQVQSLLPLLWKFLGHDREAPWREVLSEQSWSNESAEIVLQTGGEHTLEQTFFADATEIEHWRRGLAWLENSAGAAALFPRGRAGLRGRFWRTLADLWRGEGSQPIRDAAAFLARVLLRLVQQDGRLGRTKDAPDELRALLSRDGSREALALAAQLPAPTAAKPSASLPSRTPPKPASAKETDRPPPSPAPERIAVNNAGLVLLAPFFAELHARCGLLEGKLFRDFEAAHRAVHLLRFLVSGGKRIHEYSLALEKIFCGLAPEDPVVPHVPLTELETAAATQLLESVTKRWPRGAFISIDGLRSSYLHRPGRLERRGKSWHLKVERRGWDVLLPELDWTFPGLRPAWMTSPLEVDWI